MIFIAFFLKLSNIKLSMIYDLFIFIYLFISFVFSGSISVLPTILHLILGTLREMSSSAMEKKNNIVVSTCIGCLKTIISCKRYNEDKKLSTKWHKLIQSSLATVIQNSKAGKFVKRCECFKVDLFYLIL